MIRSLQEDFFQDAHEFLIFLINHINEIIVGEQSGGAGISISKPKSPETETENSITWINEIFQVSTIFCESRCIVHYTGNTDERDQMPEL